MKKVFYFSNTDFSLYNFRLGLMERMKEKDFQVFALGSETKKEITEKIRKRGISFVNFPLKRGLSFWGGDLVYFFKVFAFCRKKKPDICHNFTIKPCIYGTLAQKLAGVKNIYCTITGLGYSFERKNTLNKIVVLLYKISLKHAQKVTFQNPDDRNLFIDLKIVDREKTVLIKGSGVNTSYFSPEKKNKQNERVTVTLVARMLYQKGVKEFAEASKILKEKHYNLDFLLVGPLDHENPSAIPLKKIKEWQKEKTVRYLGGKEDIRKALSITDIFVLPSLHREGVPKALLEAGSMELPLITTDTPGCREVVENNVNGFLVEPGNSKDLADKIEALIRDKDLRERFGKASREKIVKEFDEKIVIEKYLEEVYNLK